MTANNIKQTQETNVGDSLLNPEITRRDFIKTSALVGGALAVGGGAPMVMQNLAEAAAPAPAPAQAGSAYPLADPQNILYTACLQCNTGCPIKVKLLDGVVAKIDGSPYSPLNFWPHLPYQTSPLETGGVDGWICPKGQAGIQSTYDPYRIRQVLKRAGQRGENKWESIPFEQAIEEIINGGSFADGTTSPGLNEIYALRDAKLAKEMAAAMEAILAEKDKDKKKALLDEFKTTYADYKELFIDFEHPDLGPKNNQFT
ncbi:MAG TPA: twin-arginine translocation signal domain-containing protein, partial [Anaerolineae bacterium]|nr:twin-arginine translocation signal domain-containing protein [Anaerolineae bacterium]